MRNIALALGGMLLACTPKDGDTGTVDGHADTDTPPDVDADGDGVPETLDCDDTNATVYPGAVEVCDSVDNNCDGEIDEFYDTDADGETSCGGDCNDSDPAINTSAKELCDGIDNDCNDNIDDGVGDVFYVDSDGDGYGDPNYPITACTMPSDTVENAEDCDDEDVTTRPGAAPLDDEKACMADADGDGYGDDAPDTGVTAGTDCDDSTDAIYPSAPEICDKIDNDCDGEADESGSYTEDFEDTLDTALWQLNGDAAQVVSSSGDGVLQLTPQSGNRVGTAFLKTPYTDTSFSAAFTISITGSTGGADGMAFLFLNETDPTIVANNGGALGCYELDGYGLEFDTYDNGSARYDNDGNHIAVMNTVDFSPYETASAITTLNDGSEHDVEVYFEYGDIEVYFNGSLEIDTTITQWQEGDALMFGFSGATGGLSNAHFVDDLTITQPCTTP